MGRLTSPTGRNPARTPEMKGFRAGAVIRPLGPPKMFAQHNFAALEARVMAEACGSCPACGTPVLRGCLAQHCREKRDDAHLVLEVLES